MDTQENLLTSRSGYNIRQIYEKSGLSREEFIKTYNIPRRTFEDWMAGRRAVKKYILDLLDFKVEYDVKQGDFVGGK